MCKPDNLIISSQFCVQYACRNVGLAFLSLYTYDISQPLDQLTTNITTVAADMTCCLMSTSTLLTTNTQQQQLTLHVVYQYTTDYQHTTVKADMTCCLPVHYTTSHSLPIIVNNQYHPHHNHHSHSLTYSTVSTPCCLQSYTTDALHRLKLNNSHEIQ